MEVAGARTECAHPSGCAELELDASVLSTTGRHTISLQVLRQSLETVSYVAEGEVRVFRNGIPLLMTLPLQPTRAALQASESVTYDVEFLN